ncbi:MAG: binding-protein-dependent transport system inner rane component [Chloroflexi bacterium]|nr:binding-protein-dependent transport system inner rane component [Chloroflexota bacterium]
MNLIFGFLGLIILLFVAIPLGKMIFGSDPGILWETLTDGRVISSIWLTLYSALIATGVGCVLGVPLAYLLSRYNFPGKRVLEGIVDIPVVVPHTAAGIALLFVFGRNFLIGKAFGGLGISFIDSLAGIVIAMLFVSVPFLINSAKEGFNKVDLRLEKVSRSLGASAWQTFTRITLPLTWRSILSGNIMMWARGISEFGAVIILTYYPMTAPTLIYERFQTLGLSYSQPVAAILIMVCVIAFIVLRWLAYRGGKNDPHH